MPKVPNSPSATKKERRHNPLSEEYAPTHPQKPKRTKRRHEASDEDDSRGGSHYVESKASQRILKIGRDLLEEDDAEQDAARPVQAANGFSFRDEPTVGASFENEIDDDEAAWAEEEEYEVEEIEVDPNDLDTFNKFHPSFDPSTLLQPSQRINSDEDQGETINLADLILAKIEEHEAREAAANGSPDAPIIRGGGAPEDAIELPEKVVEVYTQVGELLSRYRSGSLPKPFKILPSTPQCFTLLDITQPDNWTANAVYAATRIFISAAPAVAQEFINIVLLPKFREDVHEPKSKKAGEKKLNVHLYDAMRKALYKPAAFFKGFLFPLMNSGTCTLREAAVVGAVLRQVHVPVLHSAAALQGLCEIASEIMLAHTRGALEAGGAANLCIRVLLEKKYALPYKVIDSLVFHFLRFKTVGNQQNGDMNMSGTGKKGAEQQDEKLPVLWHQTFLAFAQRYRNDITEDQREALLDLLLTNGHKQIGPEVRRELLAGRGRGVPIPPKAGDDNGGDDTMALDP